VEAEPEMILMVLGGLREGLLFLALLPLLVVVVEVVAVQPQKVVAMVVLEEAEVLDQQV
jgi:hypothetical protein